MRFTHGDDARYQLLEMVGEGAMSTVWKAIDMQANQPVAIKRMRTKQRVPEAVQRLAEEVDILRRLNHPNVVRVVGAGTA